MPQNQEKQKRQWLGNPQAPAKISAGPSSKLMEKLTGPTLSESTMAKWPELGAAWASREVNMPFETSQTRSVGPMNWFERLMFKDALATTSPFGGISLNRPLIESMPGEVDLNDVLTHELVHVTQPFDISRLWKNFSIPYYQRPEEIEAEKVRASRKRPRDVFLPPNWGKIIDEQDRKRKIETGPSLSQRKKLVK